MSESGKSLFKRIRSAKSSLENAEQSFLDNKSMRGELDLMLAEAELKNLRRKSDVPWSWNRQLLALCGAVLLGIAGFGGWMFAKGEAKPLPAAPVTQEISGSSQSAAPENNQVSSSVAAKQSTEVEIENKPAQEQAQTQRTAVSSEEMRKLVRSARVELSKTK